MVGFERASRFLFICLAAALCATVAAAQVLASANLLPTTSNAPEDFGTLGYTTTRISALSFSGLTYIPVPPLSRTSDRTADQHFYATLDIPAGAVIDYIGLNNANDSTPYVMGIGLWQRDSGGNTTLVAGLSCSQHSSWATDRNSAPIGYLWQPSIKMILILEVEVAPSNNYESFGWVEVWWRRTVSPGPPVINTFTDVPKGSPYFKFVEAVAAAGITGGYPDGRFGVNDPITRGQMAVFLSTALGLYWPN